MTWRYFQGNQAAFPPSPNPLDFDGLRFRTQIPPPPRPPVLCWFPVSPFAVVSFLLLFLLAVGVRASSSPSPSLGASGPALERRPGAALAAAALDAAERGGADGGDLRAAVEGLRQTSQTSLNGRGSSFLSYPFFGGVEREAKGTPTNWGAGGVP